MPRLLTHKSMSSMHKILMGLSYSSISKLPFLTLDVMTAREARGRGSVPFSAREARGGKFHALLLTFGARSASPSPPERRKNYIFSDMGLLAGVLSNLANRAVLALFLLVCAGITCGEDCAGSR